MTLITDASNLITLQTRSGPVDVVAAWLGKNLAVHKPYRNNPELTKLDRGLWCITATNCGRRAAEIRAPQRAVIALARLWDTTFAGLVPEDAHMWRWRRTWCADIESVRNGTKPDGPILPDYPTGADVAAAITGGASVSGSDEADQPLPLQEIPPRWPSATRHDDGWPMVLWRGEWRPVPTLGQLESWTVGDSIAETPDGRTTDPDDPESWLSVLGLI